MPSASSACWHCPAAAAPNGQGMMNGKANTIDPELKQDLWNSHMQYRLQAFDMHVQQANDVIGILNKYNCDTTQMQSTLSTISGKRSELQTALANQDREALKTINSELRELWKQFLKEMRDSIRDHYGKSSAMGITGTAGITAAGAGTAAL